MSRNSCDGCDGCKGPDKFLEMMAKMNDPRGFLKPGQKISSADETLIRKGGLRAFFNPGTNPFDFFYGRFAKNLLVVEDSKETRNGIVKGLEGTVFDAYAAPTLEDALNVLARIKRFSYVLLDDGFPSKRGESPAQNADKLFDKIVEHSPDAKVFAYAAMPQGLVKPYRQVLLKGDTDVKGVCMALISDAEKPEFYKVLIGDDNIEKFRVRFGLDEALKGKRVTYASTPESTIELSKKKDYDIIVTDLQFTENGCEGFDVLKNVKAPVKVLWTAAADSLDVRHMAVECGANYVFHKNETEKMLELLREGLK